MMRDILDDLAGLRPMNLDPAVPGWEARREQLLHELDARVASDADAAPTREETSADDEQPPAEPGTGTRRPDQNGRRRRWLLAAAAAAAVALVVIVGAIVQTGQRVQPEPAQTVSARAVDPDRPIYEVGPGQFFLRRTSIAQVTDQPPA